MRLSAKVEYALKAVYELAKSSGSAAPLNVAHIAEIEAIPEKFLVQLLLRLSHAGVVRSIRGAGGGYMLARHPSTIKVLDVVSAIDRSLLEKHFGNARTAFSRSEQAISKVLLGLDEKIEASLNVDLETLLSYGEGSYLDYQI